MKALKITLIVIGVLLVVFFGVGALLPANYEVARSTTINASDSVIYNNVGNYNEFVKWNPWSKMEPGAKVTITGTPFATGHKYAWVGDKTGSGQMLLMDAVTNKSVTIELKFIKPFESLATTSFQIAPADAGNTVTWKMWGVNDDTMGRWMCLFMDSMIGGDFEKGLASLKEKAEVGR